MAKRHKRNGNTTSAHKAKRARYDLRLNSREDRRNRQKEIALFLEKLPVTNKTRHRHKYRVTKDRKICTICKYSRPRKMVLAYYKGN